MEKYNGWKNWDTWAVALWIDNDESNYRAIKRITVDDWNDICNERMFNDVFYFGDEIDFDVVDTEEIYGHFLELVDRP